MGGAAVNGGYVIRDGALPSLLGRYIYADTNAGLGGELHTVQLSPGSSSGDSGLGVSATGVVSFGEDACAHIYVATLGGTVYRLEPTAARSRARRKHPRLRVRRRPPARASRRPSSGRTAATCGAAPSAGT